MNIEEKIQALEQRIEHLEKSAHTEHTIGPDAVNQIVQSALVQMHLHLQKMVRLGSTLLQQEEEKE